MVIRKPCISLHTSSIASFSDVAAFVSSNVDSSLYPLSPIPALHNSLACLPPNVI